MSVLDKKGLLKIKKNSNPCLQALSGSEMEIYEKKVRDYLTRIFK